MLATTGAIAKAFFSTRYKYALAGIFPLLSQTFVQQFPDNKEHVELRKAAKLNVPKISSAEPREYSHARAKLNILLVAAARETALARTTGGT